MELKQSGWLAMVPELVDTPWPASPRNDLDEHARAYKALADRIIRAQA